MKRIAFIFAVVLLSGCASAQLKKDLQVAKKDAALLSLQVAQLKGQIGSPDTVANLRADLQAAKSLLEACRTVESDSNEMLTQAENKASELKSQYETLKEQYDVQKARLDKYLAVKCRCIHKGLLTGK